LVAHPQEGQTEKLQEEKANEVRDAKRSRKATADYRLVMDVEELLRQLYFHRGAAIQFDEIEVRTLARDRYPKRLCACVSAN
jgi:hypothetical protein